MDINEISKLVDVIQGMKQKNIFKNYIEYIIFPYYKNLLPNSKIDFEFPLTILVGKNGSGKSSTLHALYGAPLNKSCSDFWFSTEVDPINENSDKPLGNKLDTLFTSFPDFEEKYRVIKVFGKYNRTPNDGFFKFDYRSMVAEPTMAVKCIDSVKNDSCILQREIVV